MSSVPQVSHGDIGTYNLDGRVPIGQLAGGEFSLPDERDHLFAPKLGAHKEKHDISCGREGNYCTGAWIADRQWNGNNTYFGPVLCPPAHYCGSKSSLTKPHRG